MGISGKVPTAYPASSSRVVTADQSCELNIHYIRTYSSFTYFRHFDGLLKKTFSDILWTGNSLFVSCGPNFLINLIN